MCGRPIKKVRLCDDGDSQGDRSAVPVREESWEDAAQRAVKDAAKSLKHIKSIYVKNMEGIFNDDKIIEFHVNARITFELES
jgi:flavin-binding protein dodecin